MIQPGDIITIVHTEYVVSQIKPYPNRKNPICSRVILKRNGRHHEIADYALSTMVQSDPESCETNPPLFLSHDTPKETGE